MIWPPARRITQVNDLREAAGLIRLTDAADRRSLAGHADLLPVAPAQESC